MSKHALGSISVILLWAQAFAGQTYYVDQRMAGAADSNPGTAQAPWKTIARAAATARAGDTVLIRTGIYREGVVLNHSGTAEQPIGFSADAASTVVVTGADRLTDWKKEADGPAVFSTSWAHSFINWSPNHAHPDDLRHRLIGRCEQVFVQGYPLRQVLSHEKLSPGTFFVDLGAKRLYAWSAAADDLSKRDMLTEASARDLIWDCKGDYVETRGITLRYAANHAQQGAALFSGRHDTVQDCTFERTNGVGATFEAEDIAVRNCTFQENGQLGFGANRAHRLLLTGCLIRDNNIKGFNRDWEAGGNKLVLSRGVVLESSRFIRNGGHGIWFDIGNEGCTVRNCLIADNEDAGIFYEISFGLHAHDNVITCNGLAETPAAWGASSGISISSSPGCIIERNLLIGNKEGFNFREAQRTTPRIDAPRGSPEQSVWNHDEMIRHNAIAYNRDAQTWGWFDVDDERAWPLPLPQKRLSTSQPLSLESLKLVSVGNVYATHGAEGLFNWGVPWKRHHKYQTLNEVRQELGLEQDSVPENLEFENFAERDFRVPPDSPLLRTGCYPQGEIPGVRLGAIRPARSPK